MYDGSNMNPPNQHPEFMTPPPAFGGPPPGNPPPTRPGGPPPGSVGTPPPMTPPTMSPPPSTGGVPPEGTGVPTATPPIIHSTTPPIGVSGPPSINPGSIPPDGAYRSTPVMSPPPMVGIHPPDSLNTTGENSSLTDEQNIIAIPGTPPISLVKRYGKYYWTIFGELHRGWDGTQWVVFD